MTQTKYWWARVGQSTDYGSWYPTGCTDLQEAIDYLMTYRGYHAKEWLLL